MTDCSGHGLIAKTNVNLKKCHRLRAIYLSAFKKVFQEVRISTITVRLIKAHIQIIVSILLY